MFRTDGEVNIDFSVLAFGIESTFNQVFFERSANGIVVGMEEEETLRKFAISQSLFIKEVEDDRLVVAVFDECVDDLTLIDYTSIVECFVEGEMFDIVEELLDEIVVGSIAITVEELKEILEHTACSS